MDIQIPCPKCGRELKLRDRSLLGRKGKCPKCSHAFVLQEPEEVQLELAEAEPTAVGTAARWVPEGRAAATPDPGSRPGRPQTMSVAATGPAIPEMPTLGANEGAAARLKALQKKNAKRRNVGLVVAALVAVAVGGVSYYAVNYGPKVPDAIPDQPLAAQEPDDPAAMDAADDAVVHNEFAAAGSPTKGKPIELQYIPFGTQVILNIRPAELWQSESLGEELRYCLPPLAKLLEVKFEELFHRKPEQIEEAQICLIPGSQGSLPEVAAVIRLVEEAKKSQLLEDFGGERVDDYDHPIYVTGERAYLIADQKTIAMGPKAQASEMVDAIVGRNPAADGIDELLPMTDRDRHITLIFVPRTIRLHSPWWFPENVQPFALKSLDWFGDEVESAAWSFHLGEKTFYSDLIVRNVTGVTAPALERDTRTRLQKLPHDLLDTVRMMDPREAGKRKVIGRLPKMTEAFAMASAFSHGPRHVQITTPLPDRGAPNLALGTLLAWDESTRTDFTKERTTKPTTDEPKLPDLIADRLKMKIDIDFRRTPLQDAVAYIAGEIKTTIDIDGDALKAGGFTKNMPQDFQGEKMPAIDAIAKILAKYQDPQKPAQTMVIVVDEAKKMILFSTLAFCEQQKLTPYEVLKK
jgi:hypothetical protein